MIPGEEHYFVCLKDNEVIGVMTLVIGNEVELHHAATKEEYRNQGVGKRLWEEVAAFARSRGLHKVILYAQETPR